MGFKLGFEAKLYRQSTGTREAWPEGSGVPASLVEITNVKDLNFSQDHEEVDVSTRAGGGYKQTAAGLKNASIEFGMVYDTADAGFLAIQAAYQARANIALAALDGDVEVAGTQGLWADWQVIGFQKSEALGEAQMVNVTLKPGRSDVPPEWVTVQT